MVFFSSPKTLLRTPLGIVTEGFLLTFCWSPSWISWSPQSMSPSRRSSCLSRCEVHTSCMSASSDVHCFPIPSNRVDIGRHSSLSSSLHRNWSPMIRSPGWESPWVCDAWQSDCDSLPRTGPSSDPRSTWKSRIVFPSPGDNVGTSSCSWDPPCDTHTLSLSIHIGTCDEDPSPALSCLSSLSSLSCLCSWQTPPLCSCPLTRDCLLHSWSSCHDSSLAKHDSRSPGSRWSRSDAPSCDFVAPFSPVCASLCWSSLVVCTSALPVLPYAACLPSIRWPFPFWWSSSCSNSSVRGWAFRESSSALECSSYDLTNEPETPDVATDGSWCSVCSCSALTKLLLVLSCWYEHPPCLRCLTWLEVGSIEMSSLDTNDLREGLIAAATGICTLAFWFELVTSCEPNPLLLPSSVPTTVIWKRKHSSPTTFLTVKPSWFVDIFEKSNKDMQSWPLALRNNGTRITLSPHVCLKEIDICWRSIVAPNCCMIFSDMSNGASGVFSNTAGISTPAIWSKHTGILATKRVASRPPTPRKRNGFSLNFTVRCAGRISLICSMVFLPAATRWHPVSITTRPSAILWVDGVKTCLDKMSHDSTFDSRGSGSITLRCWITLCTT